MYVLWLYAYAQLYMILIENRSFQLKILYDFIIYYFLLLIRYFYRSYI